MTAQLVTVVIPTRHRDAYLKQAIDSVYAQTWQDFEIIVVNDGGGTSTQALTTLYDDRVRYILQDHAGVSVARNTGIAQARGDYIALLDDDDLYAPARLQEGIEYLRQHPDVVWLCSGFSFVDAAGRPMDRPEIIAQKTDVTLHDIAMFMFIHTSSVMVRTETLREAGGFPAGLAVSEDYDTWSRVLAKGKGAALAACLTKFRQHRGNTVLPYRQLLAVNTAIIDRILALQPSGCMSRTYYMDNLHRIIAHSLLQKRKYMDFMLFCLYSSRHQPNRHDGANN
ncbi:MAG: glycosyltransferase family 2 protein [Alphaproteobacteria bacterium]